MNYFATGTIRDNRMRKVPHIKSMKEFNKLQRGTYDYSFEKQNEIAIVRWKDSAVVTIASNAHGIDPLKSVSINIIDSWVVSISRTILFCIIVLRFVGKNGGGHYFLILLTLH